MGEEPLPWMDMALCAQSDPNAWFPSQIEDRRPAMAICKTCPVMYQCREYAVSRGIRFGTWGGLSEAGLRRAVADRNRADKNAA